MSTSATGKVSAIPKVENAPSTSSTAANKQQSIAQSHHHITSQSKHSTTHHHSNQISHLPHNTQLQKSHTIPSIIPQSSRKQHHGPPQYQPPPPPAPGGNGSGSSNSVGILKNISPQRSGIPTPNFHHSTQNNNNGTASAVTGGSANSDTNAHLNLKFPQEVPRLTTIYIPDRNPGTLSRIATARTLHQQRQAANTNTNNNNSNNNSNNNNNININSNHSNSASSQSQPSPHPSTTDDEQSSTGHRINHQLHQQEMLKFIRKSDTDSAAHSPNPNHPAATASSSSSAAAAVAAAAAANNIIRMNAAEQNRHFQSLLAELRTIKEANQRLSDDNQELRDLCCFLDDDRQKGRKLAREWQRFGRYTASVMRQEVSNYQEKLCDLEAKQQELIRDNLELKELCLYLDEERANMSASIPPNCSSCGVAIRLSAPTNATHLRDDGDGSSSSTNDEPMPSVRQYDRAASERQLRTALNDQTLQYLRSLEQRLLEHELANRNENCENSANNNHIAPAIPSKNTNGSSPAIINSKLSTTDPPAGNFRALDVFTGRPEAVIRAMQILEVREQLDRDRNGGGGGNGTNDIGPGGGGAGIGLVSGGAGGNGVSGNGITSNGDDISMSPEHMAEGEKALLREMCNVVWRKLEDGSNNRDIV